MKRILIPIILVVTIMVGGVLAYAIWHAIPVTSQDFFNRGKKSYDQSKYSEAKIQFMNAVQTDPKNRDARFYLALSYLNEKNLAEAVKQLRSLLEYYPDDIDANLRLGNIYFRSGSSDPEVFRMTAESAQKVLDKQPNNVPALILLGSATAALKDLRTSVDLFEKAIALDPQNTSAYVSLGTSQAMLKNFSQAEQAFLKARKINPKDKSAMVSLANYYRVMKQTDKAEAVFKEALTIYPADREIYTQVAQFYYDAGRFEDVEKLLKGVQTADPKDPFPSMVLADLYTKKNRQAEARTLLLELQKQFPNNLDIAGKIAVAFAALEPDRARKEIDKILKVNPMNPGGLLLLGQLQFTGNQYDEASETLRKNPQVLTTFPLGEFILGEIALKKGQVDQAQQEFQKSLAVDSGYLPARVGLAETLLDKGKLADSRAELKKILDLQPGYIPALLMRAALDTLEKNYAAAEPTLTSLIKEQPNSPQVLRQLGLYYAARGRNEDAEKSLLRAYELQPDSMSALKDLAEFYVRIKQPDRAIQKINSIPENKKQGFHYETLGTVYFQSNRLKDAESAYRKALEKDPASTTAVAFLASVYLQGGRFDEGLKELDILTTKNPSNAGAYTLKGMIQENQGKLEPAKQNYILALKADPNYATAGNNLAFIMAEQGQDLNVALGWAQMARRRQPDSPAIADTLGWVHYKLGSYVLARDQMQIAVAKQPDNPEFQYHLGLIYKGTKQIPEAQAALKKAVSSPKDFKEKSLAQAVLTEISSKK